MKTSKIRGGVLEVFSEVFPLGFHVVKEVFATGMLGDKVGSIILDSIIDKAILFLSFHEMIY